MKLSLIFLFVAIFHLSATGYSQQFTLDVNNQSIREVLKIIENQSSYRFFYNDLYSGLNNKISLKAENNSVTELLGRIFEKQEFSYAILDNKMVVIVPRELMQQNKITGTVTDATTSEPIIGANIIIENTTLGTITDENGKFSLNIPSSEATIIVSFLGYNAEKIAVNGQSVIDVKLIPDITKLEEIVVIGYGTQKKKDLTGAVAGVTSKVLEKVPLMQAQDALQGRMSGVNVQKANGELGGGIRIRVRGSSSINKTNDPIFVVDGVVRPIETLNPDDIASIDVLKDASSTAVYGSRGANGVVMITTKRGKSGQNSITFSSNTGILTTPRYDVLGAYDYAQALNLYKPGTISDADVQAYKNGTKKGIDWQDLQYQTGINQDYNLGITGGNDKTQYFVSANYINQKGIKRFSEYQLGGLNANITSNVTNWFKLDASIRYSQSKSHNTGNGGQFNDFLNQSPTMEMINSVTGYYNIDPYNSIYTNPYGAIKENDQDNLNNTLGTMVNLTFSILPGLSFSNIVGTDLRDLKAYNFASKKVLLTTNNVSNNDSYYFGWQNTMNLTYNKKLGDHNITATGVYELTYNQSRFITTTGTNLLSENYTYWNEGLAQTRDLTNAYSENGLESWFGRFNYDYKSKYMFTTTLRADGSSKFVGANKWGFFPSAAVAWNIINENFLKNQNIFQQMKLRFSAGTTGSQGIGDFDVLGLLTYAGSSYGGNVQSPGYWNAGFAAPGLKWEKTVQYDAGLDFSVLNNKLSFTLDWYSKKTSDALMQKNVPLFNGGGQIWVNQGVIQNTGLEFSIDANIVQINDLSWNSSLNGTYMKTEVKDLGGEDFYLPIGGGGAYDTPPLIVQVGEPIGCFYGYTWKGLDAQGNNIFSEKPGIIGKANPDFVFGFDNTVTYKNLQFNALISGSFGASRMNVTRFMMSSLHGDSRFITLKDAYYKSFDYMGAGAEFPTWKGTNVNHAASTQWVEKADYVRIKNLGVTYKLGKEILKYVDVRVAFNVENLYTFTKYKGLDPEIGISRTSGSTEVGYGFDMYQIPLPTTYTVGLQLTF